MEREFVLHGMGFCVTLLEGQQIPGSIPVLIPGLCSPGRLGERIRGHRQGRSRGAEGFPSCRSGIPGKGPGAAGEPRPQRQGTGRGHSHGRIAAGMIPNRIKLLKKLFGKKFHGYYHGIDSWNCVCSLVGKSPKCREFWEWLGRVLSLLSSPCRALGQGRAAALR